MSIQHADSIQKLYEVQPVTVQNTPENDAKYHLKMA